LFLMAARKMWVRAEEKADVGRLNYDIRAKGYW
jgi:hypothetical protein